MITFAVTYQALNADSRRQAYAAQLLADSESHAIERCIAIHGSKDGFSLLTVARMK